MAHMPAEALFAFQPDDAFPSENSTHAAVVQLPAVPFLQDGVLHYRLDQVEHLIGSVRNLIAIEQKKYTRIQQRCARYESGNGLLDDAVTRKATARQNFLCQRHAAVLSSLREFLSQIAREPCQSQ